VAIKIQIAFIKFLLSFGAKSFAFQFAKQNYEIKIHRTVIFPFVVYGCETWSLTLKEQHRLSVFENRVLREIFGADRDEVTVEWRRLHNEELYDLYCSPNIIHVIKLWRMRWAGHVAYMVERRSVYRVLTGRPEGKRPIGNPGYKWNDIKSIFKKRDVGVWTGLACSRKGIGVRFL
jgi:hypothetical protein